MTRFDRRTKRAALLLTVVAALGSSADAFSPSTTSVATLPLSSRTASPRTVSNPSFVSTKRTSSSLEALLAPSDLDGVVGTAELLAYSDDPLGDLLFGANGFVIAGIVATVAAVGVLFTALLPKVGSAAFTLTEEEQAAVDRVEASYDAKDWEKELTEEGTKGYVNRKRQAAEAKVAYQTKANKGEDFTSGVKDRSLRYSETNLGFVACLLRAAEPSPGDVLVDLGSGAGRSTLAAAAIFPKFKKCVGVEFLAPLVKLSNGYRGRVRGAKASTEFVNADMADYDLSSADLVLASAKYFSNGDLEKSLETLSPGARVAITDKRLGGGFRLVTQVDDPSGDLVLNTGYVFEKL